MACSRASPEALLSFVAIIAIGWITQSTPAITATMLMLMLGFDRRARALIGLSTVFFLCSARRTITACT